MYEKSDIFHNQCNPELEQKHFFESTIYIDKGLLLILL